MVLFVVLIALAGAAGFFFGTSYGRAEEQKFVVKVLAEYRQIDVTARMAVNSILLKLTVGYHNEYLKVVDSFDKFEAGIKKAL